MDELLKDMEMKGLARTGSHWIKRAVAERPQQMSILLAYSALLVYDSIDKKVAVLSRLN